MTPLGECTYTMTYDDFWIRRFTPFLAGRWIKQVGISCTP